MKKCVLLLCAVLCAVISHRCFAVGVSAKSAVLIETSADRIVYRKNADEKLPMASTTKIMTAICAIENTDDLDRKITVADCAVGVEGSSIYLKHGEHLSVRELVYGLMLSSGNDAAVAIACAVSGDVQRFAALMNETAKKIGVQNTSFKNPNGLDEEGHYTTAYDLARIASYSLKNDEFKKIVSTYTTTIPYEGYSYDRRLKNHNKLLKLYDGCIGIKTGFTKKSGRCLVSAAERDGAVLVAVTLNAPDDWNDHINMLNYGFENVCGERIISDGAYLKTARVKGGTAKKVRIVAKGGVTVCTVKGEENKISIKYKIKNSLNAPVGYAQTVGIAQVYVNGIKAGQCEAVTETLVPKDERKTLRRSAELIASEFLSVKNSLAPIDWLSER